jgi:hypothetical protein
MCEVVSSHHEVFVGLYSIFYRAAEVASPDPVPGGPPAPLDKAAEYLRCDPDLVRRPGRIRYGAIKLAAGQVLLERRQPGSPAIGQFRRALDILGVPDVLVEELRHVDSTLAELEDAGGDIIDTTPALARLQRTCCPCIEMCQVGPWGRVAVAEFQIDVNRDSQCLFHVIDPQCWPSVTLLNFKQTFVVDGAACTGGIPTCRSGQTCDPLLAQPVAMAMAGSPTVPWCGLLYEEFLADAAGTTSDLQNVLKVATAKATDKTYRVDYGLCEARGWNICDTTPKTPSCASGTCGIVYDCGFAHVADQPAAGTSSLFGTKRVQFVGGLKGDPNAWAPIALEVMVKETALAACTNSSTSSRTTCGKSSTNSLPYTRPGVWNPTSRSPARTRRAIAAPDMPVKV